MKNINYGLLVFVYSMMMVTTMQGQTTTFSHKYFSSQDLDVGTSIELPDNSYIFIVKDMTVPYAAKDAWFLKINNQGDTTGRLNFNHPFTTYCFYNFIKTSDNNYYALGAGNDSTGQNFLWIVKFDENLNLLFEKQYDMPFYICYENGLTDHNNKLLVFGQFIDTQYNDYSIFIFSMTSNADSVNFRIYQGPKIYGCMAMVEKMNLSGYYMPIWGRLISNNYLMANMLSLDYNLNPISEDSIPNEPEIFNNMIPITENSFLFSGLRAILYPHNNDHMVIEKLDTLMGVLKYHDIGPINVDTLTYPGWDKNIDLLDTNNIFAGATVNTQLSIYPNTYSYIVLEKLDHDLNPKWKRFYGFDAYYLLTSVMATSDSGCLVLASCYDYSTQSNKKDIFYLKVNSQGLLTSSVESTNIVHDALVFPNPGSDCLTIESGPQISGSEFKMKDMEGKQVMSKVLTEQVTKVETQILTSGIYVWDIIFQERLVESGKWIKQ